MKKKKKHLTSDCGLNLLLVHKSIVLCECCESTDNLCEEFSFCTVCLSLHCLLSEFLRCH